MIADTSTATTEPASLGERRQVSVLFADMVGYTGIVEKLGEEGALPFTRMVYDRLTGAVEAHGGAVRNFAGDSVMAVFGIPEVQEDAALRACRAALSVHAAFAEAADSIEAQFGVRPNMRVGVSSGVTVMAPVEGANAPPTVVGNTVNLASRLQALAPEGGCLICDGTRRLVEWLVDMDFFGERTIKGVGKPQKLWQLLSVREHATRFDASLARGLSRYIGRTEELRALSEAFDEAGERLRVIDVVAEPGLGKTRLVFEFLQRMQTEDVIVLTGQCTTNGQHTPFHPFLEIVRGSFHIRDDDDPAEIARKLEAGLRGAGLHGAENLGILLNLIGLEAPEGALAGLDGVLIGLRTRTLLQALLDAQCRKSKVVLRIEDIHWIDGASEDLLRRMIEAGGRANLMVVHTRRPEYVPAWREAEGVATLAVQPLGGNDISDLAQMRLGVETLPDALVRQVTDRAGGNPLFGEEILSFLLEQGALRVEYGAVSFDAALGESALPISMQNLLAARIDRLPQEDRELLEAAAAIGKRFDPGLAAHVARAGEDAGAALRRLQAQDIVYREADSSDYVFKHVLLRDTVYFSLVSGRRAELHLAIAEALEARNANRLPEAAETLAYHYSLTDRTDLAFTYNAMAGTKSLGIFSLGEAERFFAAALALYERDPACVGEEGRAAFLADYGLCLNISLRATDMIALAEKVRPILKEAGDSRYHAHFLHHHVACLIWNARYGDALDVRRELTDMAGRLGDPQCAAYALVSELALSCYYEPLSNAAFAAKRHEAEAALERCDDAYLHNLFLAHVGWNAICRGRVSEAREAAERMMAVGRSTDDPRALGYGAAMKALIAMLSDDYENALAMAEQALTMSRAEFERTIASAAMHAALVPLQRPGAIEAVEAFIASCGVRGGKLFQSGPEMMLGVAFAMQGRVGKGLRHIEAIISRDEAEGRQLGADWCRLYLCEIYLQILSGEDGASLGVLLRNLGTIGWVVLFGEKRLRAVLEKVRANPQFDRDGHFIGRVEMTFGLLDKAKKRPERARRHLIEARRIVEPFGPSPMLARIETALAELPGEAG